MTTPRVMFMWERIYPPPLTSFSLSSSRDLLIPDRTSALTAYQGSSAARHTPRHTVPSPWTTLRAGVTCTRPEVTLTLAISHCWSPVPPGNGWHEYRRGWFDVEGLLPPASMQSPVCRWMTCPERPSMVKSCAGLLASQVAVLSVPWLSEDCFGTTAAVRVVFSELALPVRQSLGKSMPLPPRALPCSTNSSGPPPGGVTTASIVPSVLSNHRVARFSVPWC